VSSPTDELPVEQHESAWIAAAQSGDSQAYGWLVEHYWERLYRWLFQLCRNRHQAEDLTQETFTKALAALQSFRPDSNFRAWIFRIAHNNFVNDKRRDKRTPRSLDRDSVPEIGDSTEATSIESREELRRVYQVLETMQADFRTALLLRIEDGMSFKDMAEVLNTTEETARWRVYKARQKLMKELGYNDPDEPGSR
jgi:RNA polymerase sigma-70 factor (ECF subfamily)